MKLNSCIAALLLAGASASHALVTQDLGTYTVTYDETTIFGAFSSTYGTSSSDGTVNGFVWNVPNAVGVINRDPATTPIVTAIFTLPEITITVDPGYVLNGPLKVFMGNLSYVEVGGATTGILGYADVSVNGSAPVSFSGGFDFAELAPGAGLGYFFANAQTTVTGATTIQLTNMSIVLSAANGSFSAIFAQPQNQLDFSVAAVPTDPVPEPQTWALMLVGLGTLVWTRRRLSH
jgi:hypothetical protein